MDKILLITGEDKDVLDEFLASIETLASEEYQEEIEVKTFEKVEEVDDNEEPDEENNDDDDNDGEED